MKNNKPADEQAIVEFSMAMAESHLRAALITLAAATSDDDEEIDWDAFVAEHERSIPERIELATQADCLEACRSNMDLMAAIGSEVAGDMFFHIRNNIWDSWAPDELDSDDVDEIQDVFTARGAFVLRMDEHGELSALRESDPDPSALADRERAFISDRSRPTTNRNHERMLP